MVEQREAEVMGELPALLDSLPVSLVRAREGVLRIVRPVLQPLGVTEQQWRVLRVLVQEDRSLSVGELATATALLGPSVARILPALEDRGLIMRQASLDDARRVECAITADGLELVGSVTQELAARHKEIDAALGREGREQLGELLNRLAALGSD